MDQQAALEVSEFKVLQVPRDLRVQLDRLAHQETQVQQDLRVSLAPKEYRVPLELLEVLVSRDRRAILEIRVLKAQLARRARKGTLASPELLEVLVRAVLQEQLDQKDLLEAQEVLAGMGHKVLLEQQDLRVYQVIQASPVFRDKLEQQVHWGIRDWLVLLDQ